jgi:Protein of unknown function (DUF2924)
MEASLLAAIVELGRLNVVALKIKYRDLFGEESRSSNKQFLVRRIAWRLQAQTEGDLSERARRRLAEIADETDFRTRAPRNFLGLPGQAAASTHPTHNDLRLPPPGTELRRRFGLLSDWKQRTYVSKALHPDHEKPRKSGPLRSVGSLTQ